MEDTATKIKELIASISGAFEDFVLEPMSQFKFKDVIDILLLTLLLFFVYRFIRNRRAGKLALGMILIIVVLMLSSLFKMQAIGFILQNFYQVGIIAILIVFQPELRAALEKVGTSSIITGIKHITVGDRKHHANQVENAISCICDAAFDMSKQKTGALIVIERTTKLGDYIDTGVKLWAQISSELLKNIFFKNAPLHDGAVIVRNSTVCAAGCFLRISEQEGLDSDLGTRHRAAIGISEVSDAVVVVVSEESGKVSLAYDSKIKRDFTRKTLEKELTKLMTAKQPVVRFKVEKEENDNE